MKHVPDFAPLCQSFFSKRLITQRRASPHTIAAYAQTFRLLATYAQKQLRTPPSELSLAQLDAPFLAAFLDHLETKRSNSARSRNARLASLRAFYHYAALEAPQHAGVIQRVLAIPYQRITRRLVGLSHPARSGVATGQHRPNHLGWTTQPRPVAGRGADRAAPLRTHRAAAKGRDARPRCLRAVRRQGTQGTLHAAGETHREGAPSVAQGTGG